jgi:hypothetical protein
MLPVQSEKSPLHPPKADFGRAFQETAPTAVHRNPTIPMDGQRFFPGGPLGRQA